MVVEDAAERAIVARARELAQRRAPRRLRLELVDAPRALREPLRELVHRVAEQAELCCKIRAALTLGGELPVALRDEVLRV